MLQQYKYIYINIYYLLHLIKYKFKNPFYTKTLSNFDTLLRRILLIVLCTFLSKILLVLSIKMYNIIKKKYFNNH